MSNNTKTIKNNSITGKKRKKIKTEILENDCNKFFVNSCETKLKVGDEIKFIKPESFEKYNEEFRNVPKPPHNGCFKGWPMWHQQTWGKNIRYNKLKKEIDYDKPGTIIEINFQKTSRKYDWFQNTIKVKCPKKVIYNSSEFYTQSYIEIYFEIPSIKRLVDVKNIDDIICNYNKNNNDDFSKEHGLTPEDYVKRDYLDTYIYWDNEYEHPINEFKVLIPNSRKLRKFDLSKIVLIEGNGFFI